MQTPASIKNHPYHPILVAFPIGLWAFALFADILSWLHVGSPVWRDVAYYTIAGGIIMALVAAVPGFIDLLAVTDPKLKRIGIIHMTLNLIIVILYVVNFLFRRGGGAMDSPVPLILSAIGVVGLLVSGWLGGELVHTYGLSVADHPPGQGPRPA